ncbi:MAG: hypothetical protein R3C28_05600 [Pirellulaceae bacterium]
MNIASTLRSNLVRIWRYGILLPLQWAEDGELIGRMITIGGFLASLLIALVSLGKPWYSVPVDFVETSGKEFLVLQHGRLTGVMKVAVLLVMVRIMLGASLRILIPSRRSWETWRTTSTRWALTLLVLVLAFPGLTMHLETNLSGHASWQDAQHYSLTWLGGDVYNDTDAGEDFSKAAVLLSGISTQCGLFDLPEGMAGGVRVATLGFIVDWLGYGTVFTQFEGKGWLAAAAGTLLFLVMMARFSYGMPMRKRTIRRMILVPSFVATTLISLCFAAVLTSGHYLTQARIEHAKGNYDRSLQLLDHAAVVLPAIRHHTHFVAQRGYLLLALDRMSEPEAKLVYGVEMEAAGHLGQAEETFWQILQEESDRVPVWQWRPVTREAYRALLRSGLEDLNSGQNERAHETLSLLSRVCPVSLKTSIALQYAALRLDKADECSLLVHRVRSTYDAYDALSKRGVMAMVEDNAARAHYLAGNTVAAVRHPRRSIRP